MAPVFWGKEMGKGQSAERLLEKHLFVWFVLPFALGRFLLSLSLLQSGSQLRSLSVRFSRD